MVGKLATSSSPLHPILPTNQPTNQPTSFRVPPWMLWICPGWWPCPGGDPTSWPSLISSRTGPGPPPPLSDAAESPSCWAAGSSHALCIGLVAVVVSGSSSSICIFMYNATYATKYYVYNILKSWSCTDKQLHGSGNHGAHRFDDRFSGMVGGPSIVRYGILIPLFHLHLLRGRRHPR